MPQSSTGFIPQPSFAAQRLLWAGIPNKAVHFSPHQQGKPSLLRRASGSCSCSQAASVPSVARPPSPSCQVVPRSQITSCTGSYNLNFPFGNPGCLFFASFATFSILHILWSQSSCTIILFSVENYESSIIPKFKLYRNFTDYQEHSSLCFGCSLRSTVKSERLVSETFRQFS